MKLKLMPAASNSPSTLASEPASFFILICKPVLGPPNKISYFRPPLSFFPVALSLSLRLASSAVVILKEVVVLIGTTFGRLVLTILSIGFDLV